MSCCNNYRNRRYLGDRYRRSDRDGFCGGFECNRCRNNRCDNRGSCRRRPFFPGFPRAF